MKNTIKPKYIIKVETNTEVGVLQLERNTYFIADFFCSAIDGNAIFFDNEAEALRCVNDIINEPVQEWINGTMAPPKSLIILSGIHRENNPIDMKFSVVEIDLNNVSMSVVESFDIHFSLEDPYPVIQDHFVRDSF